MYGEYVMNERNMHKRCHLINEGRTDVHNEAQSGLLSVFAKDLKDRVDVRFEVFTAVTMKNAIFWDVNPMWLL
jgi:hypothetical protein